MKLNCLKYLVVFLLLLGFLCLLRVVSLHGFALCWDGSLSMSVGCALCGQFPHSRELCCVGECLLRIQQLCLV